MLVSQISNENLTVDIIDRILFQGLEDTGDRADCIIVLGSMKAAKYRVPAAVHVYKAGRAGKLMLCGGTVHDTSAGSSSEAEKMYQAALELGIPKEKIILENSSQNTVENFVFGLTELQKTININEVHSIILVTTAYHMRRSLAIARHLFPKHITIIPCPANDTSTRRDNWMNSSIGTERAKKEVMNIVRYVKNGTIPDFEI